MSKLWVSDEDAMFELISSSEPDRFGRNIQDNSHRYLKLTDIVAADLIE